MKAVEGTCTAYAGAKALAAKLAQKLGGGGSQIPLRSLMKRTLVRTIPVPEQDVESLRAMAEDFGVQFAVTPSPRDGVVFLVCAKDHADLFRDLITHKAALDCDLPGPDAPDYGLREQPPGTSYDAVQLDPQDAARFCEAAQEQGIAYEADTRYVDPRSALEVLELPFEAAEEQMRGAPAEDMAVWESIRDEPLCSARMPEDTLKDLRERLPSVRLAAAPGTDSVLCCFAEQDRSLIEEHVPDLEWFRLATQDKLQQRCVQALDGLDSVGFATLTEDRERVFSVLNELDIEPRTAPVRTAEVERFLPSLSSRLETAMTHLREEAGERALELSCTLPEPDAAALRVSAQAACIHLEETRLPNGLVRFAAAPDAARRAEDLLRAAGIRTGFAKGARTSIGTDIGR